MQKFTLMGREPNRNTNQTSGVISWLPNNKYYKVEVKTLNPESNYINKSIPVVLNELGGLCFHDYPIAQTYVNLNQSSVRFTSPVVLPYLPGTTYFHQSFS